MKKVTELSINVIVIDKKYISCNQRKTQKHMKGRPWQQYFVVCSLDFLMNSGELSRYSEEYLFN